MDYKPLIDTKKLGQPRQAFKINPWAAGWLIFAVIIAGLLLAGLEMRGVLPW